MEKNLPPIPLVNCPICGGTIELEGHTCRTTRLRPPAQPPAPDPITCDGCERSPCKCAEYEELERRLDAEEGERAATFAETQFDYLWTVGADGLLHRKES